MRSKRSLETVENLEENVRKKWSLRVNAGLPFANGSAMKMKSFFGERWKSVIGAGAPVEFTV